MRFPICFLFSILKKSKLMVKRIVSQMGYIVDNVCSCKIVTYFYFFAFDKNAFFMLHLSLF